ncbi:MAG: hypothetical protein V3T83_17505, partial [Acidobacteriota bacterium]
EAAARVRQGLAAGRSAAAQAGDLFGEGKWAYYLGCWMIQSIELNFGKEAWLQLLSQPPQVATREFVRLYLETNPPAALRLRP